MRKSMRKEISFYFNYTSQSHSHSLIWVSLRYETLLETQREAIHKYTNNHQIHYMASLIIQEVSLVEKNWIDLICDLNPRT